MTDLIFLIILVPPLSVGIWGFVIFLLISVWRFINDD